MPGSADVPGLNLQFGALDFGSESALPEFGVVDNCVGGASREPTPAQTPTLPALGPSAQNQTSLYSKPLGYRRGRCCKNQTVQVSIVFPHHLAVLLLLLFLTVSRWAVLSRWRCRRLSPHQSQYITPPRGLYPASQPPRWAAPAPPTPPALPLLPPRHLPPRHTFPLSGVATKPPCLLTRGWPFPRPKRPQEQSWWAEVKNIFTAKASSLSSRVVPGQRSKGPDSQAQIVCFCNWIDYFCRQSNSKYHHTPSIWQRVKPVSFPHLSTKYISMMTYIF